LFHRLDFQHKAAIDHDIQNLLAQQAPAVEDRHTFLMLEWQPS